MSRHAVLLALAASVAGCGGGGPWFREAMVLYRSPLKGAEAPLFFGFVTEGHRDYMTDQGNVRPELPGAKPIDLETAALCLEVFRDSGWPETWDKTNSLASALVLHPKGHVLVCEMDGDLRVMVRPGPDSYDKLAAFVACKTALIEYGGHKTGFRVVTNSQGEAIFEREKEKLEREGRR